LIRGLPFSDFLPFWPQVRGEPAILSSGMPGSLYWLPLGWCLFPLRTREVEGATTSSSNTDDPGKTM
jgi:hypothetical protein